MQYFRENDLCRYWINYKPEFQYIDVKFHSLEGRDWMTNLFFYLVSLVNFDWNSFQVKIVDDSRPVTRRIVESFLNKFFPSGYPYRYYMVKSLSDNCTKPQTWAILYLINLNFCISNLQCERGISSIHTIPCLAALHKCSIVCIINSGILQILWI